MNISIPKYCTGDSVWVRQELYRDRTSLNINGNEIDSFLLRSRHIIVETAVLSPSPDVWTIKYVVRISHSFDTCHMGEHEICGEGDAQAITSLVNKKSKV